MACKLEYDTGDEEYPPHKREGGWGAAQRGALVYAAWTAIHHTAANLYPQYCAPPTLQGLLMSTVLAPSPQCVAMRWCINKGSSAIISTWVVLGTWLASHLVVR